jgi:hypothetical protein
MSGRTNVPLGRSKRSIRAIRPASAAGEMPDGSTPAFVPAVSRSIGTAGAMLRKLRKTLETL